MLADAQGFGNRNLTEGSASNRDLIDPELGCRCHCVSLTCCSPVSERKTSSSDGRRSAMSASGIRAWSKTA